MSEFLSLDFKMNLSNPQHQYYCWDAPYFDRFIPIRPRIRNCLWTLCELQGEQYKMLAVMCYIET